MCDPVIPGFFPDPSVCRVGNDFFLACSSFEYFPAVPILHSRDLRRWTLLGNALDRPDQVRLEAAPASGGIYAPTLRHRGGRFWLVTTNVSGGGHLLVTAPSAGGPWSAARRIAGAEGIDPDLAWDRDGTCRLTWSSGGLGRSGQILQAPIDLDSATLLGAPQPLWSGTGLQHPEAPHLYEIDGAWYLVIAEGGTERGHAVSVARGRAPQGPFEGCPANPVLTHRSTSHPVQNVGHADLVQARDGTWWSVLHGVRPRGISPGFHTIGRETFLAPVRWVDGWPRFGPLCDDQVGAPPGADDRDDFDGATLGPQWVSVRARPAGMADCRRRPGWLTLDALRSTGGSRPVPAFAGRRQQHLACRVRARVDPGRGRGGLTVRIDDRHHYDVEAGRRSVEVRARVGAMEQVLASRAIDGGAATLTIEARPPATPDEGAPDVVVLGIERDGEPLSLAALDGRYLSTEVAGGFTGRVIGMYAREGAVAFDWFEYSGGAGPPAA